MSSFDGGWAALLCRSAPCQMAPAFPVRTRQFSAELGGADATFVLSSYADRIMVIVTQLGTLGTVQMARCGLGAL